MAGLRDSMTRSYEPESRHSRKQRKVGFHARQLIRLADGKDYDPGMAALSSAAFLVTYELRKSMERKR